MKAIIAINNLGYIGLNGELPWRSSEDLKHFKKLTEGASLICGHNTLLKLPELPGRKICEATENVLLVFMGYYWLYEDYWCIGGKKTYESCMPYFRELHISRINDNTVGDTLAPDFSRLHPECKVFEYHFGVNKKTDPA